MSRIDLEQGTSHHHHRHQSYNNHHLQPPSDAGSSGCDDDDEASCFSDAEDGTASCHSQFYSTYDEYSFSCVSDREIAEEEEEEETRFASRRSSVSDSDCSVEVVVVVPGEERAGGGGGVHEKKRKKKVHSGANKLVVVAAEKDCRICHLGLESNSNESGVPIQLGCSCKDDLASAHKQCAETWFKIKGDKTCEICHSVAHNVAGVNGIQTVEQSNEGNDTSTMAMGSVTVPHSETRSFWRGHRFLNFLIACMVFAFVISWLFHFNVPSS